MKKLIFIFIVFLVNPIWAFAAGTNIIKVSAPTNLVGTVVKIPALAAVLNWSGMKGASYVIKKINPDGTIKKFSVVSDLRDPNCVLAGASLQDPEVEKGKTYTYEVRSFLIPGMLSAPAVITIIVEGTDVVGCTGKVPVSYLPMLKNLALTIKFDQIDGRRYDVYVDGKRRSRNKSVATIWPVIGSEHEVEVKLADKSPGGLVSTAKACAGKGVTSKLTLGKNYSDNIIGSASEYIDGLIDNIKNVF